MLGFSNHLPLIQAPMAGGITTASLVGAVSEAGGIGSFGFAYSSATEIKKQLLKVRKITKNPINANFFIFPEINKYETNHHFGLKFTLAITTIFILIYFIYPRGLTDVVSKIIII